MYFKMLALIESINNIYMSGQKCEKIILMKKTVIWQFFLRSCPPFFCVADTYRTQIDARKQRNQFEVLSLNAATFLEKHKNWK